MGYAWGKVPACVNKRSGGRSPKPRKTCLTKNRRKREKKKKNVTKGRLSPEKRKKKGFFGGSFKGGNRGGKNCLKKIKTQKVPKASGEGLGGKGTN